jgi:hypothetical protein
MYETYQSFPEYVKEYGLERAEGLVLRYLSDVYKALVQTVPEWARTEEVADVIHHFGALVRSVDSSLLDEWEKMRDPGYLPRVAAGETDAGALPDVTREEKRFTVLVRNTMFQILRALGARDFETAAALVDDGPDGEAWTAERLDAAMRPFFADHSSVRLDPGARSPQKTMIERGPDVWSVAQVISDPEEDDDFYLGCTIDLARSRAEGRPVVRLLRIAR